MHTFPKVQLPSYAMDVEIEDNTLRTSMEDGTVLTRRKFTRNRRTFTITWNALPTADYMTLMDFFIAEVYMGVLPFSWTMPETGKTYTVRLKSMEKFSLKSPGRWSGSLSLEEV